MKPENAEEQMLDGLLVDRAVLDTMRSAALGAMRRRRWRKVAYAACAGSAAAALIVSMARMPPSPQEKREGSPATSIVQAQRAASRRELTDEELLQQFPPGTCTLAEMNGKKVLVFLSDEAQANYFR